METLIFGQWWRSLSVTRMRRLMYFSDFVLCLAKVNQKGRTVELVQRFTTMQNFGHNWRRVDGIGEEYFPRIPPHCSSSTSSKSSWTKWATQHNSKDELSSCRCSMTSYGELQTMKRNVLLTPRLCLYLQKDFQQDAGHSSDLDQNRSGILLTSIDHEENGTESLNWWWSNSEKADTQFSEPRVHCPEERSKANEVENYRYTSVPMETRLKLFFAQLFLLISSVSTEQSQICVRNTVLVKQERGGPCWQASKTVDNDTYTFDWNFCTRKFNAKVQRTSGKAFTTKSSDKDLYWCRIPKNSWSRTVLHDRAHWRVPTIYRASGMSWVHFATRWNINWPEGLDSREHQNSSRVRSHNQAPAR